MISWGLSRLFRCFVSIQVFSCSMNRRWWGTGNRPSKTSVAAWLALHPDASAEDRERFTAGTWKRNRKFFKTKQEANTFALA